MPGTRRRDEQLIAEEIVSRVADLEGASPTALRPLHEVVDIDALATVFRDTEGVLTFQYLGYDVTMDHTGTVRITTAERTQPE